MAVRIGQIGVEPFVDATGAEVQIGQVGVEAITDAGTATIKIFQVGVEVFRTFGCAAIPTPLPNAQTRVIRRLRRAPHLSSEQVRQFFEQFQLDLQAGTGLTVGQGSNPLVCLKWSDDGGHTWSDDHFVAAGQLGEYGRRAIWRRLGQSRDRVFEISVSDPVAWRLLDAYLRVNVGYGR